MLIDSHCHLNYKGLVEDQQGVLARARAAGIAGFLNISTRASEWADIVALAEQEPDIWASIGIHPHEADAHADLGAAVLREASAHEAAELVGILAIIRTRARLMNQSITLGTVSALLVAMVVALLFTSAMISFSLSTLVGLLFILSMLALVAALISFLVEVRVATASLRIGPHKAIQPQGD